MDRAHRRSRRDVLKGMAAGAALLASPFGMVTIGKPTGDALKLHDFLLSPEGQKLLK